MCARAQIFVKKGEKRPYNRRSYSVAPGIHIIFSAESPDMFWGQKQAEVPTPCVRSFVFVMSVGRRRTAWAWCGLCPTSEIYEKIG